MDILKFCYVKLFLRIRHLAFCSFIT